MRKTGDFMQPTEFHHWLRLLLSTLISAESSLPNETCFVMTGLRCSFHNFFVLCPKAELPIHPYSTRDAQTPRLGSRAGTALAPPPCTPPNFSRLMELLTSNTILKLCSICPYTTGQDSTAGCRPTWCVNQESDLHFKGILNHYNGSQQALKHPDAFQESAVCLISTFDSTL